MVEECLRTPGGTESPAPYSGPYGDEFEQTPTLRVGLVVRPGDRRDLPRDRGRESLVSGVSFPGVPRCRHSLPGKGRREEVVYTGRGRGLRVPYGGSTVVVPLSPSSTVTGTRPIGTHWGHALRGLEVAGVDTVSPGPV